MSKPSCSSHSNPGICLRAPKAATIAANPRINIARAATAYTAPAGLTVERSLHATPRPMIVAAIPAVIAAMFPVSNWAITTNIAPSRPKMRTIERPTTSALATSFFILAINLNKTASTVNVARAPATIDGSTLPIASRRAPNIAARS